MRKLCVALMVGIFIVGFSSRALSDEGTMHQGDRYDPKRFGIPETIGRYSIFAILTEDNYVCMKPGEKRLVLQSPHPTIEGGPRDFPKKLIAQELQALNLTETSQWESTIVGPGVNREQLIRQFEQSYRFFKAHKCPTLKSPMTSASVLTSPSANNCSFIAGDQLTGGESRCVEPGPGFTIIQNHGPDMYPNNNGQSVVLMAPEFRNHHTWRWECNEVCFSLPGIPDPTCIPKSGCGGYSALLNNGMTDKGYLLQIGLYFTNRDDPANSLFGNPPQSDHCVDLVMPDPGNPFSPDGVGWVVFAGAKIEAGADLSARALCVPYIPGHQYYTAILYNSGTWWTCAADIQDPDTYRCQEHRGAADAGSTHLISHASTSVFFEKWSKEGESGGFPIQFGAYRARINVDSTEYPWPKNAQGLEVKWTQHSCGDKNYPPEHAMEGSLVEDGRQFNDGLAFFTTAHLPPYCSSMPRQPMGKASNLIVLVHGCCTDANGVSEWDDLGRLILGKITNPNEWEVVVWDWSSDTPRDNYEICPQCFFRDASSAYTNAEFQAADLSTSISPYDYTYIHLIAHSAGARLIDLTAKNLVDLYNNVPSIEVRPFIHLTFLDAFRPFSDDYGNLEEKNYPKEKRYAEHYVDVNHVAVSTNDYLPHAFNFDITNWADEKDGSEHGHRWPRIWYARSIESPERTGDSVGFSPGFTLSRERGNEGFCMLTERFPPGGACQPTSVESTVSCGFSVFPTPCQ